MIHGLNGTYIPPQPGTPTATPVPVRPSNSPGGPNPQGPGPAGLTGRPPRLLANAQSMPPRRNGMLPLRANQPPDMSAVPAMHAEQPHEMGGLHRPPQGGPSPFAPIPLLSMNGLQSAQIPGGPPPPMSPPGGPGPGDPGHGPNGGLPALGNAALAAADSAGSQAIAAQNAMMAQMQQTNLMSIQQQMFMAQQESIKSMATALAKTIKGVGKGVSDLA